jgi:hypothetical protein
MTAQRYGLFLSAKFFGKKSTKKNFCQAFFRLKGKDFKLKNSE